MPHSIPMRHAIPLRHNKSGTVTISPQKCPRAQADLHVNSHSDINSDVSSNSDADSRSDMNSAYSMRSASKIHQENNDRYQESNENTPWIFAPAYYSCKVNLQSDERLL